MVLMLCYEKKKKKVFNEEEVEVGNLSERPFWRANNVGKMYVYINSNIREFIFCLRGISENFNFSSDAAPLATNECILWPSTD